MTTPPDAVNTPPDALLAELAVLPHAGRITRLVGLARTGREGDVLRAVAGASAYHARLVARAARAAGDGVLLAELARHPDAAVAWTAWLGLPLPADPDQVAAGYREAPSAVRPAWRRRLQRQGRTDAVGVLLRSPDLPDAERAALLAGADTGLARELIGDLGDLAPNLPALARRHPAVVLDELARRLTAAAPAARDRAWAWASPALPKLAAHDPRRLLGLLAEAGPTAGLPAALDPCLAALLRADAPATVALLGRSRRVPITGGWGTRPHLVKGLRAALPHLDDALLAALAAAWGDDDRRLAALLEALPPSRRAGVFAAARAAHARGVRPWDDALLDVLPRAVREGLTDEVAGLPEFASDLGRLELARRAAPARAWAVAEPLLHALDADVRAAASTAVLGAAGRSRDAAEVTRALTLLDAARHETDPVRAQFADALRAMPLTVLLDQRGALLGFARAVAAASDTSSHTLRSLRTLAWRLLDADAQRGRPLEPWLEVIRALAGPDGLADLPRELSVPRARIRELVSALLPDLTEQAGRGRYGTLFELLRLLGRRWYGIVELEDLLLAVLTSPAHAPRREAAEHYLADPARRAARVAEILEADPALAASGVVRRVLGRDRQDLLDRYWTGGVPPRPGDSPADRPVLLDSFDRWLPEQVAAYAELIRRELPQADAGVRYRAIPRLAALPRIGLDAVLPLLPSSDLAQQSLVLRALGRTDRPAEALGVLLEHVGDDLAEAALPAIDRCAVQLAPDAVVPVLAGALTGPGAKVTARKQLARTLGRLGVPEAIATLARVAADADAHPHVRLAAAASVLPRLDAPGVAEAVASVLALGGEEAGALARVRPEHLAARHRAPFARLLAAGPPTATRSLLELARWAPYDDALLQTLLDALAGAQLDRSHVAASALAPLLSEVPAEPVLALARQLRERADAETGVDRPALQRVRRLVAALLPGDAEDAAFRRPALRAVADELEASPVTAPEAWPLRLAAINWSAPDADLLAWASGIDPLRAHETLDAVAAATRRARMWGVRVATMDAADALLGRPDAPAAAVALALVIDSGEHADWPDAWSERLARLQAHPVPAVAAWARAVERRPV